MKTTIKKFSPTLFSALLAATAVLSISQANAFERGAHRGDHRGAGEFNRIDVNQDGQLSLDEMVTPLMVKVAKRFNRKDSDDDGLLSFEEFQQTRRGIKTDLSDIADGIVQCVADIKTDTGNEDIIVPTADKFISPADKFAVIDTSNDGFISLEELQANVTAKVAAHFLVMDQNADALITEEEFNAAKAIRKATKRAIHQCINELTSEDIV